MDDTIDLLQIKIEKAKAELSEDTLRAIAAVPWQAEIIKMRETKGYTFEQLGDLELETELLLCGLLAPENYPKELESRMKITKAQANELVNEMNSLVFAKIKEELIKNTSGQTIHPGASATPEEGNNTSQVLKEHGIEIINGNKKKETLPIPEKLELKGEVLPISEQKLSGSLQTPIVKTEHTLENITKDVNTDSGTVKSLKVDPYREVPE